MAGAPSCFHGGARRIRFLPLVVKNLFRKKTRTLLTIASILIGLLAALVPALRAARRRIVDRLLFTG